MIRVEPFVVEHWERLTVQPAQRACLPWMTDDIVPWLAEIEAYSAFAGDDLVAIAGLWEKWPGSAVVWSFLSEAAGPHMIPLTRAIRRFLELRAPRRIEAYVDADFGPGRRWVELLGFTCETPDTMRAFTPDGGAQYLYSRIRNV